jgi:hypothetical protein
MLRWILATLALLALAVVPARGQNTVDVAPPVPDMRQFDYLLGDWTYVARTKLPGPPPVFTGTWLARPLDDGRGIIDEFRALDGAGNVAYYGVTIRTWNAGAGRWDIFYVDRGLDGRWGDPQVGEARFEDGEMHLTQSGPHSMIRVRYYDIQPESFRWSADRSLDGGRTWRLGDTTIEARRTAPTSDATGPLAQP